MNLRTPLNTAHLSEPTFAREAEYPHLASLCKHLSFSEDVFNNCLAVNSMSETEDILPSETIELPQYTGYYFLKLPYTDYRFLLIGNLVGAADFSLTGSDAKHLKYA